MSEGNTENKAIGVGINCDQVAWLLDIFNRYLPKDSHPRISQQREMLKYGILYEVMDIANLSFEDKAAQENGTPFQVSRFFNKE